MENKVLEMKNIDKSFSTTKVLNNINFDLYSGEVHALVGSNGAGKSTLMKILTGVYSCDSGEIIVQNEKINTPIVNSKEARISMIFQELSLVPTMTVAENIFLGQEISNNTMLNKKEMNTRTLNLLNDLNISLNPNTVVSNLSTGMQQMVEIAKAISKDAKILVFDEPTTPLSENEARQLFTIINDLKNQGIAIVYISHRMNEIFKISDKVTILKDGEKVLTDKVKNLTMKNIVSNMISEEASDDKFSWKKRDYDKNGKNILKVENLKINEKINNINFSLKEGEIVGIAGLMGSGRTEILESLFGITDYESGNIYINESKIDISGVNDAIDAGFALVPEDRRTAGLITEHSIKNNLVLPILPNISKKFNYLNDKEINKISSKNLKTLNVKYNNDDDDIKLLSGGNQQKVVISKWLMTNPTILLLDEPTSGVDIGSKTEIIDMVRSVADEGNGVIMVSSELTELLAVCDRILVIIDGDITEEIDRESISSEEDLQYAIQSK